MTDSSEATPGSSETAHVARAGSIVLHRRTKKDALIAGLRDLFSSIDYDVVADDDAESAETVAGERASHLIIIDADTQQPLETLRQLEKRVGPAAQVVCITDVQLPSEVDAGIRRARIPLLVADRDIYTLFERVAGILEVDVHADIFVCYSVQNKSFADRLTNELRRRGLRSWIDRRNLLPSELWRPALRRGVETSGVFLFIASRSAIASENCKEELGWAQELGKRIIAVVIDPIANDELPKLVSQRQFISLPPADYADLSIPDSILDEIVAAVQRDPDDIRIHRELLSRALDWQVNNKDADKLLRGRDLLEADEWIGRNVGANRTPRPVAVQGEFVTASRSAARLRRRIRAFLIGTALVVTSGLTILATLNALEAGRQERAAQSRLAEGRAFGAFVDWDSDPLKAFLQADSAFRNAPDSDALRTGYDQMTRSLGEATPETVVNLETSLSAGAFSPDLDHLAMQTVAGRASLINLKDAGQKAVELQAQDQDATFQFFKFSADGRLLAAVGRARFAANSDPYSLFVWRAASGTLLGSVVLDFSGGLVPPDIVGFTGDQRYLLMQSSPNSQELLAYVFALDTLANGPVKAPWRINLAVPLGSIDLASGTIVQVERISGQNLIRLLDITTGRPVFSWPPISIAGDVRQVYLTPARHAVLINVASPGSEEARITALTLSVEGSSPLGSALEAEGPLMIWRAKQDGSIAVIINTKADAPAELWRLREGQRLSIPVESSIKRPLRSNQRRGIPTA
jgi:hypothetical protein